MARFKQTLDNLQAIASHMPSAMAASSLSDRANKTSKDKVSDLEKTLIDIFQREDAVTVRIALLMDKLIAKYRGRAV